MTLNTDRACANCGKLHPKRERIRKYEVTENGARFVNLGTRPTERLRFYNGLFCTLRCALEFATAAYESGSRRVSKG